MAEFEEDYSDQVLSHLSVQSINAKRQKKKIFIKGKKDALAVGYDHRADRPNYLGQHTRLEDCATTSKHINRKDVNVVASFAMAFRGLPSATSNPWNLTGSA